MLSANKDILNAWLSSARQISIRVKIGKKIFGSEEITSLFFDSGSISGESYQIGSTYMNTVKIVFPSILETISEDTEVVPEIGVLVNGTYHYTKLGHFFINNFDRDRNANKTTIEASDKMLFTEGIYVSKLKYPASYRDVALEIANLAGLEVDKSSFATLGVRKIQKPEGYTYRKAIGLIAQFEGGFASFNRDGKLEIRRLKPTEFKITPDSYLLKGFTKNENAYRIGGITVKVSEDEKDVLQIGSKNGSQVNLENKVMTQEILDEAWRLLKTMNYFPFELKWRGCPLLEAGDWITIVDKTGKKYSVPNLSYSLEFNGGLTAVSKANTSSTSQATYKYRGALSQKIDYVESILSANSWNSNYYDVTQPENPKVGDLWFKPEGNVTTIYRWDGEDWIKEISTADTEKIKNKIEEHKAELETTKRKIQENLDKAAENERKANFAKDLSERAKQDAATAQANANQAKERLSQAFAESQRAMQKAEGLKVDVDHIKNEVRLKATQEEIDTVNQRIRENEAAFTAQAELIRGKVSQSDFDKAKNTINQLSTEFAVEAGKMTAALTKIDEHTTKINRVESTFDGFSRAITEIKNQEVGTRNYFLKSEDSRFLSAINSNDSRKYTIKKGKDDFGYWVSGKNLATGNFYISLYHTVTYPNDYWFSKLFDAKKEWTQSLEVYCDKTFKVQIYGNDINNPINIPAKTWTRISTTSKSPFSRVLAFYAMWNPELSIDTKIYYRNFMLTQGNKAPTDWTPAPEDTALAISTFEQKLDGFKMEVADKYANKSTVTQLSNQWQQTTELANGFESSIASLGNQLSQTVKKGNLISQINLSPEEITISGKKIRITGETHIDNSIITSAMIRDLEADKIKVGTLNGTNVNIINLNANNITSGFIDTKRIRAGSITADKLSANALQVGFNNMGNTLKLTSTSLNVYSGSEKVASFTRRGQEFWKNGKPVGVIGTNNVTGHPEYTGLSFDLEYAAGYYATFAYKKTKTANGYDMVFTIDPWGHVKGKKGVFVDGLDFYVDPEKTLFTKYIANTKDAYLQIHNGRLSGNKIVGISDWAHGKAGFLVANDGSDSFLMVNNTCFSVKEILKSLGYKNV